MGADRTRYHTLFAEGGQYAVKASCRAGTIERRHGKSRTAGIGAGAETADGRPEAAFAAEAVSDGGLTRKRLFAAYAADSLFPIVKFFRPYTETRFAGGQRLRSRSSAEGRAKSSVKAVRQVCTAAYFPMERENAARYSEVP